jgi:hypothetical protein
MNRMAPKQKAEKGIAQTPRKEAGRAWRRAYPFFV